jgi:predicted nucleic acid-binding Zn ribbon protein
MYCEFCGKKLDPDAKFCEYCGKEVVNHHIHSKKKNPNETKWLLTLIIICLFGFLFYQELRYFNSPENTLNHYLKNIKNQNYDNILSEFNIETNDFISNEIIKRKKNETPLIEKFKVEECTYEKESQYAKCKVKYTTTKNHLNTTKTYFLKKKENKRLLLFTDWIIENQDLELIDNFTLYLPKDATGTLEGINLEAYRKFDSDKDGFDAYEIPFMIKGEYNLFLTMMNGLSLTSQIKINSNTYTYLFNLKDISNEMKEKITNIGKEIVEVFYKGIINKKKKEELTSNYDINSILPDYELLKKEIEKKIILKNFEIMDIRIINLDMNDKGNILITYQMNYQYEFDYSLNEDKKNHKGNSNDIFYITIQNTELNNIEAINSLVSYFSKKY